MRAQAAARRRSDATRGAALLAALIAALAPALARTAAGATSADSIRYALRVTDGNRVGLSVTNYGFFGNNFNSRAPSFEFPLGSGYEHMSRGGIWIGAIALSDTGLFTGVSCAILDNSQGSSAQLETEFTPAGTSVQELSRIQNSPFYSTRAVSDEDLVCSYSDRPARSPSGHQTERHTPLQVLVRQRMLGFSLESADAFEVAQFTVINLGPPLKNVYFGLYAQLVSGDKNAYSLWPPSATSGPGTWYYKVHAEYDATRYAYKEHFCAVAPYPNNCNLAYCPPWAAIRLLGVTPDTVANKTVSFNWWSYSPGDTLRDTDVERYRILSNGLRMDPGLCVPGGDCSPIMLLSVGPFTQIDPGDSIRVDYAFVGGEDVEPLQEHLDYAQFAHDINYRLPAPPPSPRLLVRTGERRVDFYWDDSPESVQDPTSSAPDQKDFEGYRVYLGLDRQHPVRVAQFDLPDTAGFNTTLDPIRMPTPLVVDGVTYRYHYSVGSLKDGFNYYGAVTSYDLGDVQVPSLESGLSQNKFQAVPMPARGESRLGVTVFPNPYRVEARWDQGALVRDHYLWFANLPPRCVLKVFTLSGDLVYETRFDGSSYHGESARGLYDPRQDLDTPPPALSGSSFAWNLITRQGQAVASGLYLFTVEDLGSGKIERGKFLVVKSDREN